jgi:thiamine biosynthesis lipoprotein
LAAGARGVRAATVESARPKMGTRCAITAVHADEAAAWRAVEAAWAEIDRLEAMLSEWIETSETSAVNRHAGVRPVRVSPEFLGLLQRSLKVTRLTGGAFDVTWATVGRLWDLKAAHPRLPDPAALAAALAATGPDAVVLDEAAGTVLLRHPLTRIGFGGIGKGLAANRAAGVLREHGVTGGVVDAGGDLLAFGTREDGRPWRIGLANPLDRDRVFGYLDSTGGAVVTSGDYERFVEIDGERYSHILDPRTGYPAREVRSATIVCPDAELADALATGVSVLGVEKGLALVDALRGVEALLVDRAGKIHLSHDLAAVLTGAEEGR